MIRAQSFLFTLIFFIAAHPARASIVSYELHVKQKLVRADGKRTKIMTINDQAPAPTLEFKVGDVARITVFNEMDVETAMHWHGLLVPNDQDGVPYVTGMPIAAKSSFTYEFPIKQSGTYWYHSHSALQEQQGLYGGIVIRPEKETIAYDKELVVVLGDWTHETPEQILRNLRTEGDYYALKKRTVVSLWDAFRAGKLGSLLKMEWERMPPMDLSDVGYDVFLANGQKEVKFEDFKFGEKIRLRLINAASSTYFYINYAGPEMQIVSADGMNVKPLSVSQILMGMGETYDLILTLPYADMAYEVRATAQDVTGKTSIWLGTGMLMPAPDIAKPDPLGGHSGHAGAGSGGHDHGGGSAGGDHSGHGGHGGHDHGGGEQPCAPDAGEACVQPLSYSMLESTEITTLPAGRPHREYTLELQGDMQRFVWTMAGKELSHHDAITVRKGENVTFKLINKTMMHHPMHLHGHFFRLLNGKGERSPLKHTVDVPPMGEVEIELAADEEKNWVFHCHNLYHMAAGMNRVMSYGDNGADHGKMHHDMPQGSSMPAMPPHPGEKTMAAVESGLSTKGGDFHLRVIHPQRGLEVKGDYQYSGKQELEGSIVNYHTAFLADFFALGYEKNPGSAATPYVAGGVQAILPLLIQARVGVSFDPSSAQASPYVLLEKKLQVTDRFSLLPGAEYKNREARWSLRASYSINARTKVVGEYKTGNQRKWSLGLTKTF